MENKQVTGFWSLLHANKWMKIFFVSLASLLVLVVAGCIIYGFTHGYVYSGTYGKFAPENNKNEKPDTVKIEHKDTAKSIKYVPKIIYVKEHKPKQRIDTLAQLQAPVNITSVNQSGGITANNVTIEKIKKDRVLQMVDKNELLFNLKDKNQSIVVWSIMSDAESYRFAKQVHDFLIKYNYVNVYPNVRTFMRTPPFFGAEIKWDEKEKTNNIYVGMATEN